jgi:hypothetical protein
MTRPETRLGPMLQSLHAHLRAELEGVLLTACDPDAGLWDRWAAVRVLENELRPCLQAERELVEAVGDRLAHGAAEHLWTTGELLHALGLRLSELGRVPRSCPEFTSGAAKYRLAFDYWCRDIELYVGPLASATVPGDVLARIAQLEEERAVTA